MTNREKLKALEDAIKVAKAERDVILVRYLARLAGQILDKL